MKSGTSIEVQSTNGRTSFVVDVELGAGSAPIEKQILDGASSALDCCYFQLGQSYDARTELHSKNQELSQQVEELSTKVEYLEAMLASPSKKGGRL